MKYLLHLFIIILLVSCDDIGKGYKWNGEPEINFSRRYGTSGYDYGWNAAYSPFDEGIIIIGQQAPEIGGQTDLWAIKTDNRGLIKWEKSFGGSNNETGYDAIATSDGGFIFVGYTWSYGNEQQVYIIKTDFYGNKEWDKIYGGNMWDVGNAVIEVDGGYVIAGYSNSPGISTGNTDILLIKINSLGNLLWQKAYGNMAFPNHEWAYDIIELSDNGFLIAGARDRYLEGGLNGLVIRVDKEGNLIWEKELLDDTQISESIYSISESTQGDYFLCSTLNSISAPETFKPKLIKMDSAGNIDWQRIFNSNGKKHHQYRATTTLSNQIVIVGSTTAQLSSQFKDDAFLISVDSKGNIIWTDSYGSEDEDDWGWSVFETPKKNIIIVGSTKSFGASLFDIYLTSTLTKDIIE